MGSQAAVKNMQIVEKLGRRMVHQFCMGCVVLRIMNPELEPPVNIRQLHPVYFVIISHLCGLPQHRLVIANRLKQFIASADNLCRLAVLDKKFIDCVKMQIEYRLRLALQRFPCCVCGNKRIPIAVPADP